MTEIKKCPFCGGEAKINTEDVFAEEGYFVGCVNEDCIGSTVIGVIFYEKEDAIRAWNRRVEE